MELTNNNKMSENTKTILYSIAFIVLVIIACFILDYYQKQHLLKNGTRVHAVIINKYYEYNTDTKATSSYTLRFIITEPQAKQEVLNAFVKKESFNRYHEGDTLLVVYNQDDMDHAKLVKELEN